MNGKKHIRITDVLYNNEYAINLFASAKCNLNCKYCYIPKNKNSTPIINHKILENIRSGAYFDTMEYWFDLNRISAITHWGAEPTLTLSEFIPFYKEVFIKIPNLREISFSTNLVSTYSIDQIVSFCENFANHDVQLRFQISIDGPKDFTDENRNPGSFEKIYKNTLDILERFKNSVKIQNGKMQIHISQKPTLTKEQFKHISSFDNYVQYLQPFIDLGNKANVILDGTNNVVFSPTSMPTLIYPDDYTKEDGENLNKVCLNTIMYHEKFNFGNILYYGDYCRFVESLKNNEYYKNHGSTLCCAGNTSYGINEDLDLVLCHHSFFTTNNEFTKETLLNTSQNLPLTGREKIFNEIKLTKNDCKRDILKKLLLYTAYTTNAKHKINNTTVIISEYARAGLIDKKYISFDEARFFAMFIGSVRACHAESIVQTGSMFLPLTFLIMAFGNGLFETLRCLFVKYNKKEGEIDV